MNFEPETLSDLTGRINRIAGQMKKASVMIADDCDPHDILHLLLSAHAAFNKLLDDPFYEALLMYINLFQHTPPQAILDDEKKIERLALIALPKERGDVKKFLKTLLELKRLKINDL